MKADKRPDSSAALFDIEETVSPELLAKIPNNVSRFGVPVRPSTVRLILKPRGKDPDDDNYFGAEIFAELRQGLDQLTQLCWVSRSWLLKAERYLGPSTRNKGGMQKDLTMIWSDFRPYWVKVSKEDKAAAR